MEQYVIGIDIGTGSTKALAVTGNGSVIASSQNYYPTLNPRPGFSEQDPELIWQAFTTCIREITLQIKQPPSAISLSSCMHSLLLMDKDHLPLTPLITWADTRSEEIAARIRNSSDGKLLYESTGTPVHPMTPMSKIIWFREHAPDLFSQATHFISIKEFIWHRLFGSYEIDHSVASATGLFNIHELQWDSRALEKCGIDSAKLSEPVPTDYIRTPITGAIAAHLQVPVQTQIFIGASDGCLANLGTRATRPGFAAVTVGTSGAVRIASPRPIAQYESMLFNYILDRHTFICGGPVNNGGNVLKWVFRTLLGNETPSELDYANLFNRVSEVPPGSRGLMFLPYLHGERAPVWNGAASGAFVGIRSWHTQAGFLRAALEGVCYGLNQILQIIESASQPIEQLQVSGGFVHSFTWMQMLADITGKRLSLVQTEDASALGAALLALEHLEWSAEPSVENKEEESLIEPNLSHHESYQKYFKVYQTLYPTLMQTMQQLRQVENG